MRANSRHVRFEVLRYLLERGERGATDCELYEALQANPDTVRPRRHELMDAGLIVATDRRRPSPSGNPCTVWVARPGVSLASLAGKKNHSSAAVSRPASPAPAMPPAADPVSSPTTMLDCCRCGSTKYVETVLSHAPHNGQSIRRDCARCGRTAGFPKWNGQEASSG